MTDYTPHIKTYIEREIEVLRALDVSAIQKVMDTIISAYERDANIYIFGNGGSASTASHYQNDFNRGISERLEKKFRFFCLNDNAATTMSIANDFGYEHIFEYQLEGRLKENDLVIGISGSGNSPNILRAIEYAKTCGNKTIGITGYDGGKLANLADVSFNVPIHDMQITEDVHLLLDHLMMNVLISTLSR